MIPYGVSTSWYLFVVPVTPIAVILIRQFFVKRDARDIPDGDIKTPFKILVFFAILNFFISPWSIFASNDQPIYSIGGKGAHAIMGYTKLYFGINGSYFILLRVLATCAILVCSWKVAGKVRSVGRFSKIGIFNIAVLLFGYISALRSLGF